MFNSIDEMIGDINPRGEALRFQKNSYFFDELVKIVTDIRKLDKRPTKSDYKALEDFLLKEKGYNITIKPCYGFDAWIMPAMMDANHPLKEKWREIAAANKKIAKKLSSDTTKFLSKNEIINGTIDSKTGRIGGDFSKIKVEIGIGHLWMDTKAGMTAKETASVIMHELGHNFYYFEFLSRLTISNYLMTIFCDEFLNSAVESRRVVIIDEAKKKGYELNHEALVKAKTEEEIRLIIHSDSVNQSFSDIGRSIYSVRNFEALADQYVVRNNAAKYLSSALVKLYKKYPTGTFSGFTERFFLYMLETLFHVVTFGAILIIIAIFGEEDHTYDKPVRRIIVLRNQLRTRLNNKDISNEEKERLYSSIKDIDELIEKANDYDEIALMFWRLLPWNSSKIEHTKLQKGIEDLTASPLIQTKYNLEKLK